MTEVRDRNAFEGFYAGGAPWEIGRPQPAVVGIADRVAGRVLDSGCGTGENSCFFAARGHTVVGIDFVAAAVEQARRKVDGRTLPVTFLVKDALTLADWDERFDTAIDSGVFHVFGDEPRARYVAGLGAVVRPGGRLILVCFSNAEPGTHGPRRVTRAELEASFSAANGWVVESIEPSRYELKAVPGLVFSDGGAKAWLLSARRAG